jgi:uncharacterized protein
MPKPSKAFLAEIGALSLQLLPQGAAWIEAEQTLLIADLHFEKSTSLARCGVFLPPYDTAETLKMLRALVTELQPRRIICVP